MNISAIMNNITRKQIKNYGIYGLVLCGGTFFIYDKKKLYDEKFEESDYDITVVPELFRTYDHRQKYKLRCSDPKNFKAPKLYENVSELYQTPELCEIAVTKDGNALRHVPDELKTEKLCEIAVIQNSNALQYVPNKFKTEKFYKTTMMKNYHVFSHVEKTNRWCEFAVAQNGNALQYVPRYIHSVELYEMAVAKNGEALIYIPHDLRSYNLCKIAVGQNGNVLEYVPLSCITYHLCIAAVRQNGKALGYVPMDLRTEHICTIAVEQNGNALKYVPCILRTLQLCKIAIKQNLSILEHVPIKIKSALTTNDYKEIMTTRPDDYHEIPSDKITKELCRHIENHAEFTFMKNPSGKCVHKCCGDCCVQIRTPNKYTEHYNYESCHKLLYGNSNRT